MSEQWCAALYKVTSLGKSGYLHKTLSESKSPVVKKVKSLYLNNPAIEVLLHSLL